MLWTTNTRMVCFINLFWPGVLFKITKKSTRTFFYFADEDKWKTEARTEGGAIQEYTISYQNLVPSTSYTFRVIAYNKYGISYPAKSQASVRIINHLFLARFWLNRKHAAKIAMKILSVLYKKRVSRDKSNAI